MRTRRGLGVAAVVVVAAAVAMVAAQQDCNDHQQCNDCIQNPGCMWCTNPKMPSEGGVKNYCVQNTTDIQDFCEEEELENPHNFLEILENKPLTGVNKGADTTSGSSGTESKIVQLAPQRVRLRLRKGAVQKLDVTFRQATDYPLDLYFLMDLSNSMRDDKKQLAKLGKELADTMKNLTTQFNLGFGSFVDKVLMPYTDTAPSKLSVPCDDCSSPYSFRNDLPLTSDSDQFTEKVEAASISGNLDAPEGGFDALMQAMVCRDQIGWRDQVRRIIVFTTDAKFHHAGDGRLAGIVEPNDETCHLNSQGEYEDYDKYDYPSVGQINKVALEKEINIIFAVSKHRNLYEALSKMIETSTFGLLDIDSKNVVELVKHQYEKITSKVKLDDTLAENSPVSIQYYSSCLGGGTPVRTRECGEIKEGDEVTFHLEVTATRCPEDKQPLTVEVKTLQDKMVLEIEFECDCDCDFQDRATNETSECHDQGALVCGVCSCFEGFHGGNCKCNADTVGSLPDNDMSECRAPNDTTVCSNHGHCSCGACICNDPDYVDGKYCQCNRRQCQTSDGKECSGHGSCSCGVCQCKPGYVGTFCECEDDSKCREPGKTEVCSDHGNCVCGKCVCTQSNGLIYSGPYCEDCQTCRSGKCVEFRPCVQCQQFGTGQYTVEECDEKCTIKAQPVEFLDDKIANNARLCTFEDETSGCYFNFTYLYTNQGTYNIYVQREQQCPEPPEIMGIVFGLVAAIVAIGLLTLIIWKILTTIHDRREYARFEEERKRAQWNAEANPLYKPASNTFQNPAFAQQAK